MYSHFLENDIPGRKHICTDAKTCSRNYLARKAYGFVGVDKTKYRPMFFFVMRPGTFKNDNVR